MGLTIVLIVLFIVGIFLFKKYEYKCLWGWGGADDFGILMSWLTGILLFACLICYIIKFCDDDVNKPNEYLQDKMYLEQSFKNVYLTGNERKEIVHKIIKDNNYIVRNRTWVNNFWVGSFYSKNAANLQLFDITKLPPAKMNANVNMNLNNTK